MRTQSEQFADFALDLRWESVPPAIAEIAKGHFLDVVGIALASCKFDYGRAVLEGVRSLGEGSAATAIGSGRKLPAASAALVNGTLAHGLDFDDTHIAAIYHASAPAFAASLAAAEAAGASGRVALAAYTAALEIGCRLAGAADGAFHDRGFHPTALCGTFAAAAAAGKLQGASQGELTSALGLCGSQAAGILELEGSWLKRLHPGWAAHAGIVAVGLARSGFLGPRTVFEGAHGFYRAHIERSPVDERAPTHLLGKVWHAAGLALKPYPCCHFIHAFVDAALWLREQVPFAAIERIDCALSERLHHMVAEPRERCIRPQKTYDALFSVPYVVALALVKGRVDLAAFYDEPLDDPEILRLAALTICSRDPASDYPAHFPGEVSIHLKDGRVLQRREPFSRGTPERRLDREDITRKFMQNAIRAIPEAQAARVANTVWRLDELGSLQELTQLCTANHGDRT